jgi:small subunit ribosomal protein S2
LSDSVVQELLDAGIHFGHRASRWNPKMQPYIYGKRNNIHVIDIRETLKGLLRAKRFLTQVTASGADVLFVGTKRQAREALQNHVERAKMHYVTERWLGGTLTNFRTIRSRLERLEHLESLVNSPAWDTDYTKKMKSVLSRELRKIQQNLGGIRRMARLPGALVIIDVKKERSAVREARSLGIPTVCLLDTDGDPDDANIPIPGNDDSIRSIEVIVRHLADACEEGLKGRAVRPEKEEGGDEGGRRRGGRGRGGDREPAATAAEGGAAPAGQA